MKIINRRLTRYAALLVLGFGVALSTWAKPYKSAEIFTPEAELYGKFVIRMKAASASGVISNFFLWKSGSELESIFWEEVDVEVFGKNGAKSWQSNIITGLGTKETSEQIHTSNSSFADGYHTFAIEWTPNQIRLSVDGQVVRTTNGGQAALLGSPAQFRINFWPPNIVEWVGSWSDSVLPLHMFVNWAEYYHWENGQFKLSWRDDFEYLDQGRWATADWTFAENRADFSPKNVVVKDGYLVLAMTKEGQEGYRGNPPQDIVASSSAMSSSSRPASSSSVARSSSSTPVSSSSRPVSSSSLAVSSSSVVVSSSSIIASSSMAMSSSAPASSSLAAVSSSAGASSSAATIKLGGGIDLFALLILVLGTASRIYSQRKVKA